MVHIEAGNLCENSLPPRLRYRKEELGNVHMTELNAIVHCPVKLVQMDYKETQSFILQVK